MDDNGSDVRTVAALVTDLAGASAGTPTDLRRLAGLLGSRFGLASRALERGTDLALLDAVDSLWARGWAPRDVGEVVRRRIGVATVPAALDLLAADADRRPRAWAAELYGLGAEVWWDRGRPLTEQWRTVRGQGAGEALRTAVALVGVLRRLPALPREAAPMTSASGSSGVGPKVLARVRALLAKAESTSFAEEAEALSAKAQELMGRHALERAVVDAGTERAPVAATLRLWLDAPYVSAKSSLVHQVAGANRCRAVGLDALDLVTVVGHTSDLATVELLVTSLLVQADRAMLAERRRTIAGPSRTRSFRHAFLLSYATRTASASVGRRRRRRAKRTGSPAPRCCRSSPPARRSWSAPSGSSSRASRRGASPSATPRAGKRGARRRTRRACAPAGTGCPDDRSRG